MVGTVRNEAQAPRKRALRPLWPWAWSSLAMHAAVLLALPWTPIVTPITELPRAVPTETVDSWLVETWPADPTPATAQQEATRASHQALPQQTPRPAAPRSAAPSKPRLASRSRSSKPVHLLKPVPPPTPPKASSRVPRPIQDAQGARPTKGSTGADFMSPEVQLEPRAAEPRHETRANPPPRDRLVERLLARERDKARERRARRAGSSPPTPGLNSVAASAHSTSKTPSTPRLTPSVQRGTPKRRALSTALIRALPSVASLSPHLVRSGAIEVRTEFVVALRAGKLVALTTTKELPRASKQLLERTVALLSSGSYYTGSAQDLAEGDQVYGLLLRRSKSAPRDAIELGHHPPRAQQPGTGYFIASDGLRLDAVLQARGSRVPQQLRSADARVFRL